MFSNRRCVQRAALGRVWRRGGSSAAERGSYLGNTIMACGNCHTPRDADGKPPMAYIFYADLKPADLADIVAWLRTVPPLQ